LWDDVVGQGLSTWTYSPSTTSTDVQELGVSARIRGSVDRVLPAQYGLGPLCCTAIRSTVFGMGETRSDRLQLRVTPLQREIIESAAQSQHETITDYVVRHAVSAAKEDLADRRYFTIDDAAWVEFKALLERPPVYKPRLEKLLAQPAPWKD
jgi:uncharacterized protein (DUF1778 family)